jgi:hypothetical protein
MMNRKQTLFTQKLYPDFGYWLLVIGYWLLVIGYWLLVIGYWLLVKNECTL